MLLNQAAETALHFSMNNPEDGWSRNSNHPFTLEGCEWPTVEHYFQAMRFVSGDYAEAIRTAPTVAAAQKLGGRWLKRKRPDWKQIEAVVMTRALYTKCRTYPHIAESLLATGEQLLVEDSQYDYHWGCGRDRRGHNLYGKILMKVREKLREEQSQ